MIDYLYDSKGNPAGYLDGEFIYSLKGEAIGFVDDTNVYKISGYYIGELLEDMVVDMKLNGMPRLSGIPKPGNIGSLPKPGNRGAINLGYPDVFFRLLE